MQRYKVQESIADVIKILDSAPVRPDLMPEANIVQLANRAPIAHLAIERGLKALIAENGRAPEWTHSLGSLYRNLRECDRESSEYLDIAFADAVQFFGYNTNSRGFTQFRSLDVYLSIVGTDNAFEELRYWAIEESRQGQSPIPYISLPVHREILCALWCLFLPRRRETVTQRVERELANALFNRRNMAYGSGDTERESTIQWYLGWLNEHTTLRSALEEAVHKHFAVTDDVFITQTVHDAYKELQRSGDPAVRYCVSTLSYLPKESVRRNPDAIPEVHWYGRAESRGAVVTAAGTHLGYIERYANGAWGITPMEDGPVGVAEIAWAQADAKHYLVNRLTKQVSATVNGEDKHLRIISSSDFFLGSARLSAVGTPPNLLNYSTEYKLEFWNTQHGIRLGDSIVVTLPSDSSDSVVSVLEGEVTSVTEQMVSVTGSNYFDVRRDC